MALGAAGLGVGVGLHLPPPPGSITGAVGGGHSTGAGVHLVTIGAGAGVGVGRLHLIVVFVSMTGVTGSHLIGVAGVIELMGEQSVVGVRAALPRPSLKQVSAERAVVMMMKERMSFMSLFSVVVIVAAVDVLFAFRLA